MHEKESSNSIESTNSSPKRKIKRWEIGWYVLFILGPAAFIGPFVALFFALYFAAPDYTLFLILAILGIILYILMVVFLIRAWIRAGDPHYKPAPVDISDVDVNTGSKLNAGVMGLALFHGLFGGHNNSDSGNAWNDLYWQEKYRHHDY